MVSARVRNLHPYIPGEQPKDRPYIKLNANENPYPPAPEVVEAAARFIHDNPMRLSLYPDPDSSELRAAIAGMLNETGGVLCRAQSIDGARCSPSAADAIPFAVTPEMVYCGNGSDEVLSFIFYAFFDSGARLVLPEHTYSFYPVYAGFYGIPLETVPLRADWTLDTERLLERAAANGSGLIFANPNAPTGIGLSRADVRAMLRNAAPDRIFVVDEAYADFGGESCIPLLAEFPNLAVVRTFSKSLCGAGTRLGYAVAAPELVRTLTTVKNSLNHFPVDAAAQAVGAAACRNAAYYAECARSVVREREAFSAFLADSGWEPVPSQANFIFARRPGASGRELYERIKEAGILVRHFATPGIEEFVRITVGTKEQMDALKAAVSALG
ncbi:MAG: histidinol-phosphate transaminase [Treponemataceae bacterium]|nr:histidinol-phosphate transaminase [Treponemataceae bacterium]